MGRVAFEPRFYPATGALQGYRLTDKECSVLDTVLELNEEQVLIPDLEGILYDLPSDMVESIKSSGVSAVDDGSLPRASLRHYQTTGIAYMLWAKRCVLGDSVGLGKTIQVAGLMKMLRRVSNPRILYLTETPLLAQTQNELISRTGEFIPLVPSGTASLRKFLAGYSGVTFSKKGELSIAPDADLDLPPIMVGAHSLANNNLFQEFLMAFENSKGEPAVNVLFIDESSIVSSEKTNGRVNQKREFLKFVADKCTHVVVMNATPFESNLLKLYYQIAFVDDTFLPGKTAFQERYCEMTRMAYASYSVPSGRYKNGDEFRDLVRYRYFKRTRKEYGASMEGCSSSLLSTRLSFEQTTLLSGGTHYKSMVYDDPTLLRPALEFDDVVAPKARLLSDLLTGAVSSEEVDSSWGSSETVLVYCLYKETQENLVRYLRGKGISAEMMNGDTSFDNRLDLIRRFSNKEFRVLITNVMKGLNFGSTDHVVAYSIPHNISHTVQFEGRITRSFDIKNKHMVVLITEGTELTRFRSVISDRVISSEIFSGADYSLFLSLVKGVLNGDKYVRIG